MELLAIVLIVILVLVAIGRMFDTLTELLKILPILIPSLIIMTPAVYFLGWLWGLIVSLVLIGIIAGTFFEEKDGNWYLKERK